MTADTCLIDGVRVPRFLYGTAWKEEATARLTELALRTGFRGIDTANQRKHYFESAVGTGIAAAVTSGVVNRDNVFLQTKFTFRGGQDDRLPYDPKSAVADQVRQSLDSSLAHLGTDFVDSLLLHGPTQRTGIAASDWEAWRAMEALHDRGRARLLGISNVSLDQLQVLCRGARVRPRFVQNRCFANRGWDRGIREFCTRHGMIYQGFSLLTANLSTVRHPQVAQIALQHGRTPEQIVFRFALDAGILPITGTTSERHMQEDLAVLDFALTPDQVRCLAGLTQQ